MASAWPMTGTGPVRRSCCCTAGRAIATTGATCLPARRCVHDGGPGSPRLRRVRQARGEPAPYGAAGQAASVLGLIEELGLDRPVVAGYDVGSRTAQQLARTTPERVGALVLAPPLPGVGDRVLTPEAQTEYWYQPFHRLELSVRLLDGDRSAVRTYLEHFWSHWSGPSYTTRPGAAGPPRRAVLRRLARSPPRSPGMARAGNGRYQPGRAPAGRRGADPGPDDGAVARARPAVPAGLGDRLDEFFADVRREELVGAGHFSPLEAPDRFVSAIAAGRPPLTPGRR